MRHRATAEPDDMSLAPLAAASPPAQQVWTPFVMMGVIFVIFYLLVFAPMRRKQKQHGEMLAALKSGDRVVTNGGILGTVKGVGAETVQLRIADQVTIEVSRNAIAGLQQAAEDR